MFTITIQETRTVDRDIGHKWDYCGREESRVLDYTPSHIAPVQELVERYEQRVDSLDIAAVIAVVNKLTKGA